MGAPASLPWAAVCWAAEAEPDVICLQETKVTDALFPRAAVRAMGYPHLLVHGQHGDGVRLLIYNVNYHFGVLKDTNKTAKKSPRLGARGQG